MFYFKNKFFFNILLRLLYDEQKTFKPIPQSSKFTVYVFMHLIITYKLLINTIMIISHCIRTVNQLNKPYFTVNVLLYETGSINVYDTSKTFMYIYFF